MEKAVLVHITVVLTDTPTFLVNTDDVNIDDPDELKEHITKQINETWTIEEMCQYAGRDRMYDDVEIEICEIEDID